VLGAVAAAIWLRRRQPQRPALPVRTGVAPPPRRPSGRFARGDERRAVDIVTVVDDLISTSR
jgi:hypothetical protein